MTKSSELVRKKILKYVKEFYHCRKVEKFVPGRSAVPYAGRVYDEKELVLLVDASLDFWLTTGRFAENLEAALARFLGIKYCLLTNSGSSANLLAVTALTSPLLKDRRLMPGDEVITTACGFPTTLNPILQNGLVPVFIDVDLGTYNIQAEKIEKALTQKTKAIFVAHTLGNPVAIDQIGRIAKKHGLWWIEDNCDALGSRYQERYTGTFGDLSTCSFYPAHHMTMGEGGAVITDNALLKRIVVSLRDWGRDCWCKPGDDDTCRKRFHQQFGGLPFGYDHKYVYSHIGYNLKLTDMQAAVGCAQLKKLPGFIKARKNNFQFLMDHLKEYDDSFILPSKEKKACPSWFGFPIFVKEGAFFERADIVDHLEKQKIATRMLFGGNLLKQPAYQKIKYRLAGSLKNTDLVMNRLFWIGVYPGISAQKRSFIVQTFDDFFKERKGL